MEATSVYWIPLYTMLEDAGIEICLVNARHLKNVPGRKTDVADAQWLQQLHAVGLLHASFHPPMAIRAVRTLLFRVTLFQGLFIVTKSALRHAVHGAPCKA